MMLKITEEIHYKQSSTFPFHFPYNKYTKCWKLCQFKQLETWDPTFTWNSEIQSEHLKNKHLILHENRNKTHIRKKLKLHRIEKLNSTEPNI